MLSLYECSNVVVVVVDSDDDDVDPNAGVVISVVRGDVDQGQVEPPLEPTLENIDDHAYCNYDEDDNDIDVVDDGDDDDDDNYDDGNNDVDVVDDGDDDDDDDDGNNDVDVDDFSLTLFLNDILLVAGSMERARVVCHDSTAQNPLRLRDWIPWKMYLFHEEKVYLYFKVFSFS